MLQMPSPMMDSGCCDCSMISQTTSVNTSHSSESVTSPTATAGLLDNSPTKLIKMVLTDQNGARNGGDLESIQLDSFSNCAHFTTNGNGNGDVVDGTPPPLLLPIAKLPFTENNDGTHDNEEEQQQKVNIDVTSTVMPVAQPSESDDNNLPISQINGNLVNSESSALVANGNDCDLSNGHSIANGNVINGGEQGNMEATTPLPPEEEPLKQSEIDSGQKANKKHYSSTYKIPFPLLSGEKLKHTEKLADGTLYLTNYRIYVRPLPPIQQATNSDRVLSTHYSNSSQEQLINLPIESIDCVELRELCLVVIFTKFVQSFTLSFNNADQALEWHKRLNDIHSIQVDNLFCFKYSASLMATEAQPSTHQASHTTGAQANKGAKALAALANLEREKYQNIRAMVEAEFNRMKFTTQDWKICELNKDFAFCDSYPQYFIVPAQMSDSDLDTVAKFRYSRRIPAVTWRSQRNGCVIARSSQPVVGWLGWRNNHDERLLEAILNLSTCSRESIGEISQNSNHDEQMVANGMASSTLPSKLENSSQNGDRSALNGTCQSSQPPILANGNCSIESNNQKEEPAKSKLLILDARSYTAAFANRAMGGGCECPEYYSNCEIQFMGLNNIHSIRKSFNALRYICEASQIDQSK